MLLLCAPGGSYLDHSLVGKREDLLRPLFLYVHQAIGLGDVFLSRQELAVEDYRRLVNHDALPLQEAAETKDTPEVSQEEEAVERCCSVCSLLSDSLDVLQPVLLLLVRQAGHLGGGRGGGCGIESLDSNWFLQTEPGNHEGRLHGTSRTRSCSHDTSINTVSQKLVWILDNQAQVRLGPGLISAVLWDILQRPLTSCLHQTPQQCELPPDVAS